MKRTILCVVVGMLMIPGPASAEGGGFDEELFEAFGYEVARDRLWQLETTRRFGRGRLAELFGPKAADADIQAYSGHPITASAPTANAIHVFLGMKRSPTIASSGRSGSRPRANWSRQRNSKRALLSASSRFFAPGWPLARSAAWAAIL